MAKFPGFLLTELLLRAIFCGDDPLVPSTWHKFPWLQSTSVDAGHLGASLSEW